jgi:hypothetical protein
MTRYYVNQTSRMVLREGQGVHHGGLRVLKNTGGSYFLGCCGLSGLESFGYVPAFANWQDQAEYLACLYRELYSQGTAVYVLTQDQLRNPLHLLLLEVGAVEVAMFPNLYHGPRMLHLFRVNVRNICGCYCNKYGDAYAEPPKDDSEIIPEQTDPTPQMYGNPSFPADMQHGNGWYNGVHYQGGAAKLPIKPAQ